MGQHYYWENNKDILQKQISLQWDDNCSINDANNNSSHGNKNNHAIIMVIKTIIGIMIITKIVLFIMVINIYISDIQLTAFWGW